MKEAHILPTLIKKSLDANLAMVDTVLGVLILMAMDGMEDMPPLRVPETYQEKLI